ncbi:response regulator [Propionivibrio dicarboxylicus]|uniref:DNA-binding response regulator, NarL/FixJ family, contains REC and HTH domains n=1 Tax=Propionivibrio dicarboxylicus TaxID=83767 RepID=A0A1G8KNW3_9RHOO|nr:response regulator transcription factor [Propionivibrio dicarboxylicus]SDI45155.1 DNA-binding response regulator, NarL/FixJ family, contains REC and HTH domains [Propionivibrio dicarboxylicus]
MIRILIADDHTLVREGLKQILAASRDMAVKGEAGDGFETLARVREGGWDILLLDMSMPGRSGVDLIRQIRAEAPRLPILILSMYKEDEYAIRTIRAGAAGYLCKDSASAQLISAIRKVAAGGHFISPEVAGELAYGLIVKDDRAPHESLSDREFQIFRQLAAGDGVVEIAQRLNLSPKTVSTYKTRLFQKMGMTSVAELVRYGVRHALFEDVPPG